MASYDGGKYFIIPQEPETREKLLAVDRKSKGDCNTIYHVPVDYDWFCNTVATVAVETFISAMAIELTAGGLRDGGFFNFYDLFTIRVSVKRDKDAEKEGNINILFEPGKKAIELISDDVPDNEKDIKPINPIDQFGFEDKDVMQAYTDMERHIRYCLTQKHTITMSDRLMFGAFAVTYVFITNIFKELLHELGSEPDKEIASINFNDDIEFHAIRAEDGVKLTMRPGMNAKLLIKADDATEIDDSDE